MTHMYDNTWRCGDSEPLYHWKPVLGTKLLGFSIGRGLGALKGLRFVFRHPAEDEKSVFVQNRRIKYYVRYVGGVLPTAGRLGSLVQRETVSHHSRGFRRLTCTDKALRRYKPEHRNGTTLRLPIDKAYNIVTAVSLPLCFLS